MTWRGHKLSNFFLRCSCTTISSSSLSTLLLLLRRFFWIAEIFYRRGVAEVSFFFSGRHPNSMSTVYFSISSIFGDLLIVLYHVIIRIQTKLKPSFSVILIILYYVSALCIFIAENKSCFSCWCYSLLITNVRSR